MHLLDYNVTCCLPHRNLALRENPRCSSNHHHNLVRTASPTVIASVLNMCPHGPPICTRPPQANAQARREFAQARDSHQHRQHVTAMLYITIISSHRLTMESCKPMATHTQSRRTASVTCATHDEQQIQNGSARQSLWHVWLSTSNMPSSHCRTC
jgi:hypothetical protein